MSTTATRLAAYQASELRILKAQQLGHGDRSLRNAELAEVRQAIKDLEAQLKAEAAAAARRGPMLVFGDFSRRG